MDFTKISLRAKSHNNMAHLNHIGVYVRDIEEAKHFFEYVYLYTIKVQEVYNFLRS